MNKFHDIQNVGAYSNPRTMQEAMGLSLVRNFILTLISSMREHEVRYDHNSTSFRIHGLINLSHENITVKKNAACQILVPINYTKIQPTVYCLEKWMRVDIDWHAFQRGLICFENEDRWTDQLAWTLKNHGNSYTGIFAAKWLRNSVASLVSRHYFASRHGIANWSSKWSYWEHGESGSAEYRRSPEARRVS